MASSTTHSYMAQSSQPSHASKSTSPQAATAPTLFPSPPLPSFLFPDPQPPVIPFSSTWQCHQCHNVYRISVTNRCLSCRHYFCSSSAGPKRKRSCHTEIDYSGWQTYNRWRRESEAYTSDPVAWKTRALKILARSSNVRDPDERAHKRMKLETEQQEKDDRERLRRLADGTHDCSKDCDFPTECSYRRYEAQPPYTPQGSPSPVSSGSVGDDNISTTSEQRTELLSCIEDVLDDFDSDSDSDSDFDSDFDFDFVSNDSEDENDTNANLPESPASPLESPPSSPELEECRAADEALAPYEAEAEEEWLAQSRTSWQSQSPSSDDDDEDGFLESEDNENGDLIDRQEELEELANLVKMGNKFMRGEI